MGKMIEQGEIPIPIETPKRVSKKLEDYLKNR